MATSLFLRPTVYSSIQFTPQSNDSRDHVIACRIYLPLVGQVVRTESAICQSRRKGLKEVAVLADQLCHASQLISGRTGDGNSEHAAPARQITLAVGSIGHW